MTRPTETRPIALRLAAALALALITPGCSPPPAPPGRVHPPSVATVSVAAPVAPLPDASILARRVEEAYRRRARGEVAGARADLDALVQLLASAGRPISPGLGAAQGYFVEGRVAAGFTFEGEAGTGTLFFDTATGRPFAFARDVALNADDPTVDAPYFVAYKYDFYDPVQGRALEIDGTLITIHPDGHRAYVLDAKCLVHEWSIAEARVTRPFASHLPALAAAEVPKDCVGCGCDGASFQGATITGDGRSLASQWGRWSLKSGAFTPLPIPWKWTGYHPEVSPDGRWLAYLRSNPKAPPDATANATLLVLRDQDKGTSVTADRALPAISNGAPLSFGANPPRVCVTDYSSYAFSVPSLSLLGEGRASAGSLLECPSPEAPKPRPRPDLLARLAAQVCFAGGYLLPREHCAGPR